MTRLSFPWTLPRTFRAGLTIAGAALSSVPAAAQDFPRANPCAIFGAGYVAVQGSGGCARIGGRVRLETEAARPLPGAALGFSGDDGPSRAHLRLPGGGPGSFSRPRMR